MTAASTTTWWVVGWAVGLAVTVVAAGLLVVVIALARRIVGQAEAIAEALDGARANTDALYDVSRTNLAVDQIARHLATVRERLERA